MRDQKDPPTMSVTLKSREIIELASNRGRPGGQLAGPVDSWPATPARGTCDLELLPYPLSSKKTNLTIDILGFSHTIENPTRFRPNSSNFRNPWPVWPATTAGQCPTPVFEITTPKIISFILKLYHGVVLTCL